jgi:cob(I)alamin adenosyltransferase
VCRRAERGIVAHFHQEKGNSEVVVYINRLSDYLFVAARWINAKLNVADVTWDKAR